MKGTTTGTVTDMNGKFTLSVPADVKTLVFSFVGMKAQEFAITGKTSFIVAMEEETVRIEEVVAVGYGTQRKKDVTGAVTIVNVEKLVQQAVGQVTSQLQGRASGVTILGSGRPGDTPIIRIRGINTLGNNNPLFVVDGLPSTNIDNLNPSDIATMQVLKDASASIYGSRAANGVIIITTKTGIGKVKVQYDAYYGVQTVKQVTDMNSPQEQADLKWMAMKNSNPNQPPRSALYGSGDKPVLPDYIAPTGLFEGDPRVDPSLYKVNPFYTSLNEYQSFYRITRANKEGTNWFREVFSPAPTMNHNLAVSGGNESAKYLFSMNYLDQKGTAINSYFKRYTLRANSQFNVNKRIRIGENIAFSLMDNPAKYSKAVLQSEVFLCRQMQTIVPVYDIMGNYGGTYGGLLGQYDNPVATLERTKNNKGLNNRLSGNVFAEVDIIDDLTLRTSFGGEISTINYQSFVYPQYENSESNTQNYYSAGSSTNSNWTWTNTLQYKKVFNKIHNLTLIAGTESFQYLSSSISGTTYDYYSFDPNFTNLNTGTGTRLNNSSNGEYTLFSYIGRLNYSLMDKYLLNATIRRDGSSRFLNEKYGWFPAVTAAWRISEERFMKGAGLEWIDDLKIRLGYGIMGNQLNVEENNAFSSYYNDRQLSNYDITGSGKSLTKGFTKNRIGNPDAIWEKDISSNIGFDATLLKGKLNLTVDYYIKDIEGMLYNPELLGTAGVAQTPYVNIAAMKNKGIDLSVFSVFNITKDLKFDAALSFTSFNNKILNVSNAANYFDVVDPYLGTYIRNEVGHSVGQFYGYQIEGFWNSQEEIDKANESVRTAQVPSAIYQNDVKVGRFRYADINGDGKITTADRTFLGNPNPDFSYGLSLGLNYKNFDFSIFLYGVVGNETWNKTRWFTDFNSSYEGAKSHTALYDSWTPDNHNAKVAIQEVTGSFSSGNIANSYFVENGAYLRAKDMQIGYTFSPKQLERFRFDKLRVYIQAANLFTITKYSGLDPEVGGSTISFGVDNGTYPSQQEFLMGVNLTF